MDHGGKRPYPCPECSFTCKTKQQLNEHRRKHSVKKENMKKKLSIITFVRERRLIAVPSVAQGLPIGTVL